MSSEVPHVPQGRNDFYEVKTDDLRTLFEDCCLYGGLHDYSNADLLSTVSQLHANGIGSVTLLRQIDPTMLAYMGVSPDLGVVIDSAFQGRLLKLGEINLDDNCSKETLDSRNLKRRKGDAEFLDHSKCGENVHNDFIQSSIDFPDDISSDVKEMMLDIDRILPKEKAASYVDMETGIPFDCCRLCLDPNAGGEKEFFEQCFHVVCKSCMRNELIRRLSVNDVLCINCPATDCPQEVPVQVIQGVLTAEEYESFLEATLMGFVGRDANTVPCPNPKCGSLISIDDPTSPVRPVLMSEKDDKGQLLSHTAYRHFSKYRIRCTSCQHNFCIQCKTSPYHKGYTCETYGTYLSSKHCRFCHTGLSKSNRSKPRLRESTPGLRDVCNQSDCVERQLLSCDKTLECGCFCCGIVNEEICLPCLKCDLNVADDYCSICYVEALQDAPCIQLVGECSHVFHFQCAEKKLVAGYSGARITFSFSNCPLDDKPILHPSLNKVLAPVIDLRGRILELAMMRLDKDERHNDPKLVEPTSQFYRDPQGYALHIYLFFMCFECHKPYFAGGYQCQEASAGFDPAELVCPACQPEAANIAECNIHGKDWIAFKCRYCCEFANWFCWGNCHFCNNCHDPGLWQSLVTYQKGTNKKKIWQYKQCNGIKDKVAKVKALKISEAEKLLKYEALVCNPRQCPLGVAHPPSGFEFGMGCTMCADKGAEEANQRAAEKQEEEAKLHEHFLELAKTAERNIDLVYTSDRDENGLLYYLGTLLRTKQYRNPLGLWFATVLSSDIAGNSDKPSLIGLRSTPCEFQTVDSPQAFLTIAFETMFSIKPTYYTLTHHATLDSDYLRTWELHASGDGRRWTVVSTHSNDSNLSQPAQSHSWSLSTKKKCRHFKLILRGGNSSGRNVLALGGFEIYGKATMHY